MKLSASALAGILLAIKLASAAHDGIFGLGFDTSDCQGTSSSLLARSGAEGASPKVLMRRNPTTALNVHISYMAEWFDEQHMSSNDFLQTTARVLNVTAADLSARINQPLPVPATEAGGPNITSLVKKLYCQEWTLHVLTLFPRPVKAFWRSVDAADREGVPAGSLSEYVALDRLRPVMGAVYTRPDNSRAFVLARNPGTADARYYDYTATAEGQNVTAEVLASKISMFFALDLRFSDGAPIEMKQRIRAMELMEQARLLPERDPMPRWESLPEYTRYLDSATYFDRIDWPRLEEDVKEQVDGRKLSEEKCRVLLLLSRLHSLNELERSTDNLVKFRLRLSLNNAAGSANSCASITWPQ